jgi:ABC-type sugar transport system ATPase subunit
VSDLVLKNVSKSFGKSLVLDNISLELPAGELLVLLGPSGCGKTTLLRLIAGLETVDSGEIYIGSRRVDQLAPKDRNIALVFQNYSLYPHMTVEKNLAFPLKVARWSKEDIERRVGEIAELLGLGDRMKSRPGELSGGQRQRVALGRAIVREPSLFLLDEPLSNLDAELRARMRREIVRIQRQVQRTAIHVTHDQTEALTMADRVAVLNSGRLEQIGTPEEIYTRPATRFVAEFVGSPKVNMVDGQIDRHVLIPFGLSMMNNDLRDYEGRVLVGLRPEAVRIVTDGPYVATVTGCEYLGDRYNVTLSFKGTSLVISGAKYQLSQGDTIAFDFDQNDLFFFDVDSGRRLA